MPHIQAIQRHAALVLGIILCGWLGAVAARWLVLPTGGPSPGLFEAQSPVVAMLAVIMILLVSTGLAAGVARLTNAAVGLFVLGIALFVLARRGGTVLDLVFSGSGLTIVALETLIWAALILGAAFLVFRIAGPLRDIEPDEMGRQPHPIKSRAALISAAAGILVLPVVWFVAQSTDKGQALAAVFLGSVVAGLVGRLISPHVQPILLFAAPCVFGALGHFVGIMLIGGAVEDVVTAQALPSLNVPMPVDYAAGSLAGVAIGLGWARSMLHHEEHSDDAQPRGRA